MSILRCFVCTLCFALLAYPNPAMAVDIGTAFSKDLLGNNKGAEFISGDFPGAVMMKVNVWGAVSKPGIHYVPAKTDLVTLLSYAGGPMEQAKLGDVTIRRTAGGKTQLIEVDVDDLLDGTKTAPPTLEANDTIVVPKSSVWFSDKMMQTLTVVASILSITLGSIILKKEFSGGK